jgi:4'-phosphopantetheinyl transferase EntD
MARPEVGVASGLLAGLVPAAAVAVETFHDDPEAQLFPAEEALLARAVNKRRREFATGRACARRALTQLGVPPSPLLPGPDREPRWPIGIVGSITHCDGYRAAVVARSRDLLSVGIDAEPNGPLPEGVLDRVSLAAERAWLRAQSEREPAVHWARLLFCAKEAVYKTWFPLAHRWLGFEDAEITLAPATDGDGPPSGAFDARLLVSGPVVPGGGRLARMHGRYVVERGLVVTAIALEATP